MLRDFFYFFSFCEKSRNLSKKKDKKKDKSRNFFKFVSVLLSASVERVGVSHMQDFYHEFCSKRQAMVLAPLFRGVTDYFEFKDKNRPVCLKIWVVAVPTPL